MGFTDAVKLGFDNYATFSGRSSRAAYWWWFLFALLVGIASNLLDVLISDAPGVISTITSLALLLPGLAVAVRRLHDTNRSGWWLLIILIPLIGFIVLLVFYLQEGDEGENRFGPPPIETLT